MHWQSYALSSRWSGLLRKALAGLLIAGSACAQTPQEANAGIQPGRIHFDLISRKGERLPWTDTGPVAAESASKPVFGDPMTSIGTYNAGVMWVEGDQAYFAEADGQLTWYPPGEGVPPQTLAGPTELPERSGSFSGMAWNLRQGVLALVTNGQQGQLYRYDTRKHRWLDVHLLHYPDVTSVAHDEENGGYVAVTAAGQLLILSEDVELKEVRPLGKLLPEIASAYGTSDPNLRGLIVFAQGSRLALVNVRNATVTHVWTYELGTRQRSLSYLRPDLSKARPASPASAPDADAVDLGSLPFKQRVEAWLQMAHWRFLALRASADPVLGAHLLLGALLSMTGLLALAAGYTVRPLQGWRRKLVSGLAVLLLCALPLLALLIGSPSGTNLLMHPLRLAETLLFGWKTLTVHIPAAYGLRPETRYQLMATSAFAAALLAMGLVLFAAGRRRVRILVAGFMLMFALAPALHFARQWNQAIQLARTQETDLAVFKRKCQSAGVQHHDAAGALEGIRLTGLRQASDANAASNKDWPEAGIPGDRVGLDYIRSFLDFEYTDRRDNPAWGGIDGLGAVTWVGYRFVDVLQADGAYLRYRLDPNAAPGTLLTERIPAEQAARYAVNYARNDTPEDRKHWVAGATITISDTQTGAVLAESRNFAHVPLVRDPTDGPQARSWNNARTCPADPSQEGSDNIRWFVEEVLQRLPR